MSDKELADRLVELKIVQRRLGGFYWPTQDPDQDAPFAITEKFLVRDWRVAGAVVMERVFWLCTRTELSMQEFFSNAIGKMEDSLPRAIIEAGLEALSDE